MMGAGDLIEPRFLGDGVTASFDGYQIWLSTPREDGPHRIALEPSTYGALNKFADDVAAAAKAIKE